MRRLFLSITLMMSFAVESNAAGTIDIPEIFKKGPPKPLMENQSAWENAVLALSEAAAELASVSALAEGCGAVKGEYPIAIQANGLLNKPELNNIKISWGEKTAPTILNANIEENIAFRGQVINIELAKPSQLKNVQLPEYSVAASMDSETTLLVMESHLKTTGQNNQLAPFSGARINHIYEEPDSDSESRSLIGWGMSTLSKNEYPINKFWVRLKAYETKGQLKRIFVQQDRLIGTSSCRVLVDSALEAGAGDDKEKDLNYVFKGKLTISESSPTDDIPQ